MFRQLWANPWVRAGALAAAALALVLLALRLQPVLIPLAFAFIVAYIFDPVADRLERMRLSRTAAVLWIVAGVILALLAAPVVLLPSIVVEAKQMVTEARAERELNAHREGEEAAQNVFERWVDRGVEYLPLKPLVIQLGWAKEGEDFDPREVVEENIGLWIQTNAEQYVRAHGAALADAGMWAGKSLADVFALIGNTLVGAFLFVGNFVLFSVVTIYLLKDYDRIIASADELTPPRLRAKSRDVMGKIDVQLRSFLRGQAVVCCCLGVMYLAGFLASGVPFALTLALFGGLASFVPFLGIVLTFIPAVGLTLVDHGLGWHVLGVLATFGIAQFLEGNFLTPRIVGSQVGLAPVWVILAIMVFGTLLGFLGVLIAVPMAAVLKVLVVEGLEFYRTSPVFTGGAPEPPESAAPVRPSPSPASKPRRVKR